MQAALRLRETLRSLTPSELDGINDLKLLFLHGLRDKSVAELELEVYEVEASAAAFGEELTWAQMRAECELLLARLAAITEAREARLLLLRRPVLQ